MFHVLNNTMCNLHVHWKSLSKQCMLGCSARLCAIFMFIHDLSQNNVSYACSARLCAILMFIHDLSRTNCKTHSFVISFPFCKFRERIIKKGSISHVTNPIKELNLTIILNKLSIDFYGIVLIIEIWYHHPSTLKMKYHGSLYLCLTFVYIPYTKGKCCYSIKPNSELQLHHRDGLGWAQSELFFRLLLKNTVCSSYHKRPNPKFSNRGSSVCHQTELPACKSEQKQRKFYCKL